MHTHTQTIFRTVRDSTVAHVAQRLDSGLSRAGGESVTEHAILVYSTFSYRYKHNRPCCFTTPFSSTLYKRETDKEKEKERPSTNRNCDNQLKQNYYRSIIRTPSCWVYIRRRDRPNKRTSLSLVRCCKRMDIVSYDQTSTDIHRSDDIDPELRVESVETHNINSIIVRARRGG